MHIHFTSQANELAQVLLTTFIILVAVDQSLLWLGIEGFDRSTDGRKAWGRWVVSATVVRVIAINERGGNTATRACAWQRHLIPSRFNWNIPDAAARWVVIKLTVMNASTEQTRWQTDFITEFIFPTPLPCLTGSTQMLETDFRNSSSGIWAGV